MLAPTVTVIPSRARDLSFAATTPRESSQAQNDSRLVNSPRSSRVSHPSFSPRIWGAGGPFTDRVTHHERESGEAVSGFATLRRGEVSERFKVPLSKSGVVMSHRGFESRPLRPSRCAAWRLYSY